MIQGPCSKDYNARAQGKVFLVPISFLLPGPYGAAAVIVHGW